MNRFAPGNLSTLPGKIWDAVVIGAGPAGGMAAMELARRGCSVLVVDRQTFPRSKVCGGCLNSRAVECLSRAGLHELLPRLNAVPIERFHLTSAGRSLTVSLPGGVAISRSRFDNALIEAAVAVGATFLPGTKALLQPQMPGDSFRSVELSEKSNAEFHADGLSTSITPSESSQATSCRSSHTAESTNGPTIEKCHVEMPLTGASRWSSPGHPDLPLIASPTTKCTSIRARVVLVATGLGRSIFQHTDEFSEQIEKHSRIGVGTSWFERSGRVAPGTIAMTVGKGGYVGMVRVEDGSLNLAAALEPGALKRAGSPAQAVAGILSNTEFADLEMPESNHWKGTPLLTRHLQKVAAHRVFALGDAAGYVEPFTGEGMAWALESALALAPLAARAAMAWDPELEGAWIRLHREIVSQRQFWCRRLATVLRHPTWAGWGVRLAAAFPGICRPIVHSLNRPAQFREPCPS